MTDELTAATRRIRTVTLRKGRYAGRTYELWQQTMGDMCQLREEALQQWRRSYIECYTRNADLMPTEMRAEMRDVFRHAAEISQDDLPRKVVTINDKPTAVEYWIWWAENTLPGMIYAAWLSMRAAPSQRDMTIDQVGEIFTDAMDDLRRAVSEVGEISAPTLGNEPTPPAQEALAAVNHRVRKHEAKQEAAREELLATVAGP